MVEGFSKRYNTHLLVYFEMHENMESAITREKQIKCWKRQWKLELIERNNPDWMDLWPSLIGDTPSLDPGFRRDDAKFEGI